MNELTGGTSAYYRVRLPDGHEVDAIDLIEALALNFSEGNIFKALWRRAAARLGIGKPGTTSLYDAEKIVFFGERELARERRLT